MKIGPRDLTSSSVFSSVAFRSGLLAGMVLLAGCVAPDRKFSGVNAPGLGSAMVPLAMPSARQIQLTVSLPEPLFGWMQIDAFFPARSRAIYPEKPVLRHLVDTPGMTFPRAEQCSSADGKWLIYTLSDRVGEGMEHTIFLKNKDTGETRALFTTLYTFQVLWSPDSHLAAVSVLTPGNRSEVYVLNVVSKRLAGPIDVAEPLAQYFSEYQLRSPIRMIALRWCADGTVVLRARGREYFSERNVFGFEVLVDPDAMASYNGIRLIRGYVAEAENRTDPSG